MNILDQALSEVPNHNQVIQAVHSHVWMWMGEDFFLRHATDRAQGWVQVDFKLLGQEHHAYVSLNLVNATLAPLGLVLEDMSPDALHLWLLSVTPQMPEHLSIQNLTVMQELPDVACVLDAFSYNTSQALGWQFAFLPDALPLANLSKILKPYHKGVMASVLAKLPIAVPLIACAIEIPANELEELETGDILLLGGV